MNYSIIRAFAACMCILICEGALADGAAFLQSSAYVSRANEASMLSADEIKRLTPMRGFALSTAVVVVNRAALESNVITIALPDGTSTQYIGAKSAVPESKMFLWRGKSSSGGSFVYAMDGKAGSGRIREGGHVFHIGTISERFHIIADMDISRGLGEDDTPKSIGPTPPPLDSKGSGHSAREVPLALGDPTIRILTVFSPGAANLYSGNIFSNTAIEISDLNESFWNSGVHLNAVSAGSVQSGNSQFDSSGAVINAVQISRDIPTLRARDDTFADVVMLVTKSLDPGITVYGQALEIYATAQTAFAVVEATGLLTHTYQHEFGHLLGARHQAAGGTKSNDSGSYPYSYGHGW